MGCSQALDFLLAMDGSVGRTGPQVNETQRLERQHLLSRSIEPQGELGRQLFVASSNVGSFRSTDCRSKSAEDISLALNDSATTANTPVPRLLLHVMAFLVKWKLLTRRISLAKPPTVPASSA